MCRHVFQRSTRQVELRMSQTCFVFGVKRDKDSREKNATDLLLRVRLDKKSREKNDTDLFLRVG